MAANPDEAMKKDTEKIIPGDTCALLRSQDSSSSLLAVLIHRYWKQGDGLPSTLLLWIKRDSTEELAEDKSRYICTTGNDHSHVFRRLIHIKFAINDHESEVTNAIKEKPFSRLADGSSYVLYRILLYCSDFQK